MTDYIVEPERKTPVLLETDIVVCGAGPSGLAASICAAREGFRVALVDQTAMPGGMMTHAIGGLQDVAGKGGFVRELIDDIRHRGLSDPDTTWCLKYNQDALPYLLDDKIAAAGVRPLYLCAAAAPLMEQERVAGVIVESKCGRSALRAPIVIDATGDGDMAARAGASFIMGRSKDGQCQAISLNVTLLEYDGTRMEKAAFREQLRETAKNAGYDLPYDNLRLGPAPMTRHTWKTGLPHITGYDATDALSLTDALVALRAQTRELHQFLQARLPMFAQSVLGPSPALPGVRESRRIECDATVSDADAVSGRRHEDGLFLVRQAMDIHRVAPGEPDIVLKPVKPYHIPYGALLPKGVDNMLVVGRCIGGDHEALASYRVAGNCLAMGEAAAIAAAYALRNRCDPRCVPGPEIAAEMERRGYER